MTAGDVHGEAAKVAGEGVGVKDWNVHEPILNRRCVFWNGPMVLSKARKV